MGLAYGLERLGSLGIKPLEIRLTGSGSKSKVWRQICTDIFNVPVVCLAPAEGAALGAALQGAWVDRLIKKESGNLSELLERAVKLDEGSRAQRSATALEVYGPLYGRFNGLTQKLASAGFL